MVAFQQLPPFDFSRDFVARAFFRCGGVVYERNAPFDKEALIKGFGKSKAERTARLLYESHKIFYRDADEADALAPVTVTDLDGGWYEVNVHWLEEPEKVRGRDQADARAQEIKAAGEPDNHHGVALLDTGNGWWTVNAGWLPEPEKVHGQEAAYTRATELREEGPPEGFHKESGLITSTAFNGAYSVGGQTVRLEELAVAAQEASGLDKAGWNGLDQAERDERIKTELDRQLEAAKAPPGDGSGQEPAQDGASDQGGDKEVVVVGSVVLVAPDTGSEIDGRTGAVNSIEGNQAEVYSFEGPDGTIGDQLYKATVSVAALSITEPKGEPAPKPELPSKDERVASLVAAGTVKSLRDQIASIDKARAAQQPPLDPLPVKSDHNKTDLARLIVEVDGDLKAADGGAA